MRVPYKYVVVRYVPDVMRDEPINIGVIVQGPDGEIISRFPGGSATLNHLPKGTNEKFLRLMISDIEAQLARPLGLNADYGSLDDAIENWQSEMQNQIRFTPARVTLPDDPNAEADSLFESLVSLSSSAATPRRDRAIHRRIRALLMDSFASKREYESRVRENLVLTGAAWPSIRMPFAYVNGALTLANPMSLDYEKPDAAVSKMKIWKENYEDLFAANLVDPEHVFTIVEVPREDRHGVYQIAQRALANVSRVIPNEDRPLSEFARRVAQNAQVWDDVVH